MSMSSQEMGLQLHPQKVFILMLFWIYLWQLVVSVEFPPAVNEALCKLIDCIKLIFCVFGLVFIVTSLCSPFSVTTCIDM